MSITPTAIIHSASPRPYAVASTQLVDRSWMCTGQLTFEHNPTTTGSKRLDPGFLAGVLT